MKTHAETILTKFEEVPGRVDQAVDDYLEELGSSQDPIFWKGEETTPTDLRYRVPGEDPAQVRITYWGGSLEGRQRLIRGGTVLGMIADRIHLSRRPFPSYVPRKEKASILKALRDADLSYPFRLKLAAQEIRRLQGELARARKK